MRTSQQQYDLLITFMEEHGDLSKRCTNARGRISNLKRWENLCSLLNSDGSGGDNKTLEKWKKVWSDYKNNTKKKAARLHRAASGTGGGPAVYAKLTDLEQRVLNIIGYQTATGLAIEEAGISQDLAVPEVPESEAEQSGTASNALPRQEQDLELYNQPGHSSWPHIPPPMEVEEEIIENTVSTLPPEEVLDPGQTPPARRAVQRPMGRPGHTEAGQNFQVTASPQELPHLAGQTPPGRRAVRRSPRRLSRRPTRQTAHTEAAQHFLNSDTEWRSFKIKQHNDNIEIQREKNRIRQSELEIHREWQNVGIRVLNLVENYINRNRD